MQNTFLTNSQADTEKLGEEFASKLKPMDMILLFGDLGSGKTTFSKGIAKGLSVPNRVISPTFVVLRTYTTKNKVVKKIYHLDLYRLTSEEDIQNIALNDLINDREAVTIIEWPELIKDLRKSNTYRIYFEHGSEDTRKIQIEHATNY